MTCLKEKNRFHCVLWSFHCRYNIPVENSETSVATCRPKDRIYQRSKFFILTEKGCCRWIKGFDNLLKGSMPWGDSLSRTRKTPHYCAKMSLIPNDVPDWYTRHTCDSIVVPLGWLSSASTIVVWRTVPYPPTMQPLLHQEMKHYWGYTLYHWLTCPCAPICSTKIVQGLNYCSVLVSLRRYIEVSICSNPSSFHWVPRCCV